MWNAYYADVKTMDGAVLVASIRRSMIVNETTRRAFIDMVKLGIVDVMDELGLVFEPVKWDEGPAPQSERSGSA